MVAESIIELTKIFNKWTHKGKGDVYRCEWQADEYCGNLRCFLQAQMPSGPANKVGYTILLEVLSWLSLCFSACNKSRLLENLFSAFLWNNGN